MKDRLKVFFCAEGLCIDSDWDEEAGVLGFIEFSGSKLCKDAD